MENLDQDYIKTIRQLVSDDKNFPLGELRSLAEMVWV